MIKLTPYAAKGGCACKIGPHILDAVLKSVQFPTNDHVLTAMGGAEDAGVYVLNEEVGLVSDRRFFHARRRRSVYVWAHCSGQ